MKFTDIAGNSELKSLLIKQYRDNRVSHAMMLHENEGCGGVAIALAFIQYMVCENRGAEDSCGVCPSCKKVASITHPDLHMVLPVNSSKRVSADKKPITDNFIQEWRGYFNSSPYVLERSWYSCAGIEDKSGNIAVAEANEIIRKLNLRSFEGGDKFLLLWLPEKMNREAANKLLKIVEEPPMGTYFIMVTNNPEEVITTIRSRCQLLRVTPLSKTEILDCLEAKNEGTLPEREHAAALCEGSPGRAFDILSGSDLDMGFCDSLLGLLNCCSKRDISALSDIALELASMGRERQKQFCIYASDLIRRSLMVRISAPESGVISPFESGVADWLCNNVNEPFFEYSYKLFNDAIEDIERNVNSKFIFADLSNRFFVSLQNYGNNGKKI